jgi:transcriptional regulator with XRE-family HTH domain
MVGACRAFGGFLCTGKRPTLSAMIKLTDEAIRSRLGARIYALRTARALSQAKLAERLARRRGWKYISTLECGRGSPSVPYLIELAHQGFEIKLASLLFGIDENLDPELQALSEGIAGLPVKIRRGLLRSVELMLRAGAKST